MAEEVEEAGGFGGEVSRAGRELSWGRSKGNQR